LSGKRPAAFCRRCTLCPRWRRKAGAKALAAERRGTVSATAQSCPRVADASGSSRRAVRRRCWCRTTHAEGGHQRNMPRSTPRHGMPERPSATSHLGVSAFHQSGSPCGCDSRAPKLDMSHIRRRRCRCLRRWKPSGTLGFECTAFAQSIFK